MSFSEYVEKKLPAIEISLDYYREGLYADISALVLKNGGKSICELEISRFLGEMNHPNSDAVMLAVQSGKLARAAEIMRSGLSRCLNRDLSEKIETAIFEIQANSPIKPERADELYGNFLSASRFFVEWVASLIGNAVSSMSWNGYRIHLEAMRRQGWLVDGVRATVGDSYQTHFECVKTPLGLSVSEVEEWGSSDRQIAETKELAGLLKESSGKLQTFYMNRPISERNVLEDGKRQISLGFGFSLPESTILSEFPNFSEGDTWKVRLSCAGQSLFEKAPVAWLERCSNEG